MKEYLKNYKQELIKAIEAIPAEAVENLINHFRNALKEDRQVFVFGNGGSASNASHFITDLGKSASDKTYRRFRCLSLNESISWITAIGNDYAYEDIFLRQLKNYANPGDTVMVLSVSGNSPNLVKAIEWCREKNIFSVALLGAQKGKLSELADSSIIIESSHYGIVEDCQMNICHMVCYAFIENEILQQP